MNGGRATGARRRPERVVLVVVVLLVAYAAFVGVRGVQGAAGEVFPLHDWDVVGDLPEPGSREIGVRVVGVDGRALDQPRPYDASVAELGLPHVPGIAGIAEALARVTRGGDAAAIAFVRGRLETRFLGGAEGTRYEVVERRSDLLERHRCRCFSEEIVVASYEVGR